MNKKYVAQMEKKNREIVYWGIGRICQYCLECYPEINPCFFIDSYSKYKTYKKKDVKHPEEVCNWSAYYIIITVKNGDARKKIQGYLEKKGLIIEEDFCTYDDFYSCASDSLEMCVHYAEWYAQAMPGNPILLKMPLEGARNYNVYMNFLSSYIKKRGKNNCIVITPLSVLSRELAAEKTGCPVIPTPGGYTDIKEKRENFIQISNKLTEKELKWLKELGKRKDYADKENIFYDSVNLYYYYKLIIEIIKPSKLIIWSNWSRESYMLGYLADMYSIPYGYMEYGWLPGTYQADPRGIGGQSEYAVNPEMFDNLNVENIYDIGQIKQYVKAQRLDTGNFVDTEKDKVELLKVNPDKKNLFLVGLGERGLQTDPKSDYWKKYVSNVIESTEEALNLLIPLCRKNNWNLIFKPHPGEPVPELAQEDVIVVRDMEIDRLIELADVVVSIASAVDYKVLIYGKPLVQLGITGLQGKNCTYIVSQKEMLEEQIILALKNGMTKDQTENYDRMLQILLQKYLWDDMSERSIRYGRPIDEDFLE